MTEAKAIGSKFYFTGQPCKEGHIAPRYTSGRSCVECINGKAMERYWENPSDHHKRARQWDAENRDRVRVLTRDRLRHYRAENPDRFREYNRKYRLEKPHIHRNANRNRKARIRGSVGSHTPEDVAEILRRQKYRCAECSASVRKATERHVDHIMPLSRGGSNGKENLQILCPPCNLRKAAKHPLDFAREQGRLL